MIRTATGDDQDRLTDVLARAFADDPLANWLVRSDEKRDQGFRLMFAETMRFGLQAGEVFTTQESEGAAIWFAPGRYKMGVGGLFTLLPRVLRSFGPWATMGKVLAVNEVGKRHPKEPHWYLFSFGVDPSAQGKGVGGALLRHALAKVDAEKSPAYLETALEKNLGLYQRFGFTLVEKVELPRGAPPVWRMWRDVQRDGEPSGARRGASAAAVPPRMPGK
jgi:ribosomal protein S18 acetylase RimI-like enzyme